MYTDKKRVAYLGFSFFIFTTKYPKLTKWGTIVAQAFLLAVFNYFFKKIFFQTTLGREKRTGISKWAKSFSTIRMERFW